MEIQVVEAFEADAGDGPQSFSVQLDNRNGQGRIDLSTLGEDGIEYLLDIGVRCSRERESLRIDTIFDGITVDASPGLLSGWNATHLQVVEVGDSIVAVDGKSGDPIAMRDALRSKAWLRFEVACGRPRKIVGERVVEVNGDRPETAGQLRQRLGDARSVAPQMLLLSCEGPQQLEDSTSLTALVSTNSIYLTDYSPLLPERMRTQGQERRQKIEVENRRIMLKQLQDLMAFIRSRCTADSSIVGWLDLDKNSATHGQALKYESFNFHQARQWLINPVSKVNDCSYVEAISPTLTAESPIWFVSHAWDCPLVHLLACLECQVQTRRLPASSTSFWVGAFASHPKELDSMQGKIETGFAEGISRALSLSAGMLLVCDENGAQLPRLWCCAEELLAVANRDSAVSPALLDVAATHSAGPTLLADGLTEVDGPGGSSWMRKIQREAAFPVKLFEKVLDMDAEAAITGDSAYLSRTLSDATATAEDRRSAFLASSAAAGFTSTSLNLHLRATFAIAAWRQALERDLGSLRTKLVKQIANNTEQRRLNVNFAGCSKSFRDDHMGELAKVIPPALSTLELGFYACTQITNDGLIALGKAVPKSLESLRLEFWWCRNIGDWGVRGLGEGLPAGLTNLALSFEDCHLIGNDGLCWLTERFPQRLTELDLNFWNCTRIDDVGVAELASDLPRGLISLKLTFYCWGSDPKNAGISDKGILALAKALPAGLKQLSLAFLFCQSVTDEGADGIAAAVPEAIEQLSLDFRGCSKVSQSKQKVEGQKHGVTQLRLIEQDPRINTASTVDIAEQASGETRSTSVHPMKNVIDMFRSVDVASCGTIQRRHLFYLLQLLYPALIDDQLDLLLRAAGLPESDAVPYEKLLTWIYNGS